MSRVGRAARPPDPRAARPHLPPDRGDVRRRRHAVAVRARLPVAVRRRLGEHLSRRVAGARHPVGAVCAGVTRLFQHAGLLGRPTSKRCDSRSRTPSGRRALGAPVRGHHVAAGRAAAPVLAVDRALARARAGAELPARSRPAVLPQADRRRPGRTNRRAARAALQLQHR